MADGSSLEGRVGDVRSPAALLGEMLPKLPESRSFLGLGWEVGREPVSRLCAVSPGAEVLQP